MTNEERRQRDLKLWGPPPDGFSMSQWKAAGELWRRLNGTAGTGENGNKAKFLMDALDDLLLKSL